MGLCRVAVVVLGGSRSKVEGAARNRKYVIGLAIRGGKIDIVSAGSRVESYC